MHTRLALLGLSLFFGVTNARAQPGPALLWQTCRGGSDDDRAFSVVATTDGGSILAGRTASNDGDVSGQHGAEDLWLVKLDASGQVQWQRCLGGSGSDMAHSVAEIADGAYIVAGQTTSNDGDVSGNHGQEDAWVLKVDANGTVLWQHCFGGSLNDNAHQVIQTDDGGYAFVGRSTSNDGDVSGNHGDWDHWLVRLDLSGNILWQHTYGGSQADRANSLVPTDAGGFVFCGYAYSTDGDVTTPHGDMDVWVLEVDAQGALQWEKSFGGSNYETMSAIARAADGGYFLSGFTGSADGDVSGYHGTEDLWALKLDAAGALEWQRSSGGSAEERGWALVPLPNGGCVFAGHAFSNDGDVVSNATYGDFWLMELDSIGALVWEKCLGGSQLEEAQAISATSAGDFVVAGWTESNDGNVSGNHGSLDAWVTMLAWGAAVVQEPPAIPFNVQVVGHVLVIQWSAGYPLENALLVLTDATGRTLSMEPAASSVQCMDLGNCRAGTYVLSVGGAAGRCHRRFAYFPQ